MLICTISTASHLSKAACLAESLKDSQANHAMLLCLVERDRSGLGSLAKYFTRVVLASELGLPRFEPLMFRYAPLEACMAVKAQILLWAIREYSEEDQFLYLDSDIFAYSRFEELEFALPRAEILLTPHHVQDECTYERICDNMLRTLLCGVFNSGFIAVRRSPKAISFLEWWNEKLGEYCYKDESRGLYFEQKWLDIAISFFDVTVFREPGYNVANWNLASRCLSFSASFGYQVNGRPLRFFHFSMVDSGRDLSYFRKHVPAENPVFKLRDEYVDQVDGMNAKEHSGIPWSYNFYRSGERIAPEVRNAWRTFPELSSRFADPFSQSNGAMNFAEALWRKHLATARE